MIRDLNAEKQMRQIAAEIWSRLNTVKPVPEIESKQGGGSGAYYSLGHVIRMRTNVWAKMPLVGKRLLMIHELMHAAGMNHGIKYMYCHAFDLLSLSLYREIYGEDDLLRIEIEQLRTIAKTFIKEDEGRIKSNRDGVALTMEIPYKDEETGDEKI